MSDESGRVFPIELSHNREESLEVGGISRWVFRPEGVQLDDRKAMLAHRLLKQLLCNLETRQSLLLYHVEGLVQNSNQENISVRLQIFLEISNNLLIVIRRLGDSLNAETAGNHVSLLKEWMFENLRCGQVNFQAKVQGISDPFLDAGLGLFQLLDPFEVLSPVWCIWILSHPSLNELEAVRIELGQDKVFYFS